MWENKIPIIFIHRGDTDYLPASILQASHASPDTPVILIGDAHNTHYGKLISNYEIKDFSTRAEAFVEIYKHYSTNGHTFELICLQRWFILNEFLLHFGISKCIYLDSDVLVYSNLKAVQKELTSQMTVVGISGHTNFINSAKELQLFCDFIWNIYADKNADHYLKELYDEFLSRYPAGGISDMTMFTLFRNRYPECISDLSVVRNDTVFDITLDTVREYQSKDGFKLIEWRNKIPYAFYLSEQKWVQFHTLHFQGKCKHMIYRYTTFGALDFMQASLYRFRNILHRFLRKLKE